MIKEIIRVLLVLGFVLSNFVTIALLSVAGYTVFRRKEMRHD